MKILMDGVEKEAVGHFSSELNVLNIERAAPRGKWVCIAIVENGLRVSAHTIPRAGLVEGAKFRCGGINWEIPKGKTP